MTKLILLCLLSFIFQPHKQLSKPNFVLAGGGTLPPKIKDQFVKMAGGKHAIIVVIPSASSQPNPESYITGYFKDKVANITIIHTTDRVIANDKQFCKPLLTATGVWLCGGDQNRLLSIYSNTLVATELHNLMNRGGVIGGTSAGASAVCNVMVFKDQESVGFNLWPNVIVDQHFNARNRLPRLLRLLKKHPTYVGVGIDENTAVSCDGQTCTVIGGGKVSVCQDNNVKVYADTQQFVIKK